MSILLRRMILILIQGYKGLGLLWAKFLRYAIALRALELGSYADWFYQFIVYRICPGRCIV